MSAPSAPSLLLPRCIISDQQLAPGLLFWVIPASMGHMQVPLQPSNLYDLHAGQTVLDSSKRRSAYRKFHDPDMFDL